MTKYILVVDDQLPIRLLVQEMLLKYGYKVRAVASGWECLNIMKSFEKPALILLDYQMPNMTGLEVLSVLKKDKNTRKIPVIMITATDNIEERAKSYGACEVLFKPLDMWRLKKVIDTTLDDSELKNIHDPLGQ